MELNSWSCGECIHEEVCKHKESIEGMFAAKECVTKGNTIKTKMEIECSMHAEAE